MAFLIPQEEAMNFSILRSANRRGSPRHLARSRSHLLLLTSLALLFGRSLRAQQANDSMTVDKQTLQFMLQRIDELEARVRQLEADKQQAAGVNTFSASASSSLPASASTSLSASSAPSPALLSSPAPAKSNAPLLMGSVQSQPASPSQATPGQTGTAQQQEPESSQSENVMAERMDLSKTLLRIRGFGDLSLVGGNRQAYPPTNQPAQTTSFALGQLDLFTTSDISDKFKFIGEIVFEGGPDNIYGVTTGSTNTFAVDIERYIIQYSYNDYFNVSAGRWHTGIGYYNTAYHHSTWLQTTTGRPLLFQFEDRGGILPIHTVGVSATGLIPSGPLGLHYLAEAGNGRESRTPLISEPVQNVIDDSNHKAFNLGVFARPEKLRGLQAGFSIYRDVLSPQNSNRIGETIMAMHAVVVRSNYEWLNEAMVIRHSILGESKVYNTPAFYTQISRQFGSFRPYFRYQYINAAKTEPIFPDVGLYEGPSAGVRFDASEFVALKLQYDYTVQRQQPNYNTLTLQIGFTF
jgi:hypothetical protein